MEDGDDLSAPPQVSENMITDINEGMLSTISNMSSAAPTGTPNSSNQQDQQQQFQKPLVELKIMEAIEQLRQLLIIIKNYKSDAEQNWFQQLLDLLLFFFIFSIFDFPRLI